MKKKATGLISVPMSNVPGAEDVEVNTMRDEDIEAANHGGFNQMEVGDFAKDLEFVKKKIKKKASEIFTDFDAVKDAASRFGAELSTDDPEAVFKSFLTDIVLKTDVYWGPGDFPAEAPSSVKKKIVKFWEDKWTSNSSVSQNAYKDFLYNNIDRGFLETLGKSVGGGAAAGALTGAAITGLPTATIGAPVGAGIGALVGGAAGLIGGLASQWNDEVIGQVEDFYNVLMDYKKSRSVKDGGATASASQTAGASGTTSFAPGTELEDVGGGYSYKIISDSEVEVTKLDGTTINVTPNNAAQYNINWDLMMSNLADTSKVVKKSANFNFNITKVSNNMKKELIKLNAALNGLGYKDLVKTAALTTNVATPDVIKGKHYIWPDQQLVIKVKSPFVGGGAGDDAEMVFNIIFSKTSTYYDGVTTNNVSNNSTRDYEDNLDDDSNPKLLLVSDAIVARAKSYDDVERMMTGGGASTRDRSSDAYKARVYSAYIAKNLNSHYFEQGTDGIVLYTNNIYLWDDNLQNWDGKIAISDTANSFPYLDDILSYDSATGSVSPNGNSTWKDTGLVVDEKEIVLNKSASYLKDRAIIKIAAPAIARPPTAPAAQGSNQAPAAAKKSSSGGGSSTINDWGTYIRGTQHAKPNEAVQIMELWKETHPSADKYSDYQAWWKQTYSNGGGHVADVIRDLTAMQTAGASGAPAVDDSKLFNYLTTPLIDNDAKNRSDLVFNPILAKDALKSNIITAGGGKRYMNPAYATRLLSNPGWKTNIIDAYTKDIARDNLLDTMLDGAPTDAGTTSSTSGAQQQTQQQMPGRVAERMEINGRAVNVISLGTWGGDQIYIDKDSLNSSTVELYVKDNKTGTVSKMGPGQIGRSRQYLGPLEISKAKRALVNNGISQSKADAFGRYMAALKSEEKRKGLFSTDAGRAERTKAREDAGEALKNVSSRQSRLDNLKKKGII